MNREVGLHTQDATQGPDRSGSCPAIATLKAPNCPLGKANAFCQLFLSQAPVEALFPQVVPDFLA